ncbi:MAG TPA: winged helix-turn-helix domain-containing protein [Pyrinomonadaceae bacterium]|jgi:Tol biopolymer transport system component/DNA-binding winged helix-turn-helix (wHTH) protein
MSSKTLSLYEFDEFRVDANQKCLWHADQLVSLTPKAFETLLVLIRRRGEIVGKDVLLDEVWADTFVEESTLSQNILTLRKTLGAFEKDKQFIVTVPRRGYRFVANVKEISADEEFFVVEKRTRTHIVAEQKEIHDSKDTETAIAVKPVSQKTFSRKYLILGAVLGALAVLTAGVLVVRYFSKTSDFAGTKFQKFKIVNLFSDADIKLAVISPDGKYLALVKRTNEAESLIVRQIDEANSLEIVPKFDGRFTGAVFAPASDYVFYSVYPKNSRVGELYKIPILGGTPQQIVKDIDSAVSVSADRKKIAFIRRYPNEKETALMTADADGKNERKLAVRAFGEGFQTVSFAPDGKSVACAAFAKTIERPMEIILVNTETGEQKSLTPHNWSWIGQTAWLKDGSGIAFVAFSKETPNLTDEVWFVSIAEGKARLLENGINGVFGMSLTGDANSLVAVKSDKITSFAVSSLSDLAKETTLLTKNGDESLLPLGADWTPDGKIVYSTINNGNADVWTIEADGGGQKQLTADANADVSPKISADGKFIYFLSNRSGLMSVWRMNADGANAQKITENQDVFSLDLSPDGREIFYTARAENIYIQKLWKISADGSGAQQLTDKPTFSPKISPDGKALACYFPDAQGGSLKLTLLSAETGEILRQIETPPNEGAFLFDWNRDGQSLLVATKQNDTTTLRLYPADGKPPTKLKDWQNESLFRLNVSKDGKNVFYEKGVTTNSVLLLRDAAEK